MHSLFHTAVPPFTYWMPESLAVLQWLEEWRKNASEKGEAPPIVTQDAGPNLHVLVPESDRILWRERLHKKFGADRLLEDGAGAGAECYVLDALEAAKALPTFSARPFRTRVPGKFVLAGEHAVLRGTSALALPHPEFALEWSFEPDTSAATGEKTLRFEPASLEAVLQPILKQLKVLLRRHLTQQLSTGAERFSDELDRLHGVLRVQSTIPMGAGLGSSAALSVAAARWGLSLLGVTSNVEADAKSALHSKYSELLRSWATEIEDYFHGKSSGMDVAVIAESSLIRFRRGEAPQALVASRLPRWSFVDTGLRASTRPCVEQVQSFCAKFPELAQSLDALMESATQTLEAGLALYAEAHSPEESARALALLAEGMHRGQHCFEGWGLVPDSVRAQISELRAQGALACKLTGAGNGGYLLVLWPDSEQGHARIL